MQAGEIDGMLADLIAVGLFNRDEAQVKVVATSLRATQGAPQFRVLAAPGSDIASAQELIGVPVAISQNTIIEYITDRLLQAEGLSSDQIKVTEISAIPVRFEQLMAGQVQAATLPDPLAQGALAAGALLVVDDSQHSRYSQSVLVFAQSAVEAKTDTIEKFLKAWNRAAGDMNGNPEEFTDLLIDKGRVPESFRDTYQMPSFPVGEVPTEAEWQDVVDWMLDKGLIEHPLPYDGSVLSVFVEG